MLKRCRTPDDDWLMLRPSRKVRLGVVVVLMIGVAACDNGGGNGSPALVTTVSSAPEVTSAATTTSSSTTSTVPPLSADLSRDNLLPKARRACSGETQGIPGAPEYTTDRPVLMWVPDDRATFLLAQELTPSTLVEPPMALACLSFKTRPEVLTECAYEDGSIINIHVTDWMVRFIRADNGQVLYEAEAEARDDFCRGSIWVEEGVEEVREEPVFEREPVEALADDLNPWVSPRDLCGMNGWRDPASDISAYQTAPRVILWESKLPGEFPVPEGMLPAGDEVAEVYLCVYRNTVQVANPNDYGTAIHAIHQDTTVLGKWFYTENRDNSWLPDIDWVSENVGTLLGYE